MGMPVASKWRTLRVSSVSACTRAVAAMMRSKRSITVGLMDSAPRQHERDLDIKRQQPVLEIGNKAVAQGRDLARPGLFISRG